jgi:hypothetical protein
LLVSAALVGTILVIALSYPREFTHQLALSFTRQATPYTELYFSDPESLPTTLSSRVPSPFGFTIANHQGHDHFYAYTVTLSGDHRTSILEQGTFDLKSNANAAKVVDVVAPARHQAYLITVAIANPRQTIHFWSHS